MVEIGKELRMRVMIIEEDKEPYTEMIWNDLETLRKKLGNVEVEVIEYGDILIVYNARSIIDNLPINRYIDDKLAIRGTFLITKNNTEEMDFNGLTDEQVEKYMKKFSLEREEELEF